MFKQVPYELQRIYNAKINKLFNKGYTVYISALNHNGKIITKVDIKPIMLAGFNPKVIKQVCFKPYANGSDFNYWGSYELALYRNLAQ